MFSVKNNFMDVVQGGSGAGQGEPPCRQAGDLHPIPGSKTISGLKIFAYTGKKL